MLTRIAFLAMLLLGGRALGQDQDLAQQLQNPIADLVSVPLQNNFEFGVGPGDDFRYVLNLQPVIPIGVGARWNLVSRTIVPIVSQPELVPDAGSASGLGDVLQSAFLSPKESGAVIWGAGAVALLPTATDDLLGGDRWGLGPTAVVLTQMSGWTVGALANHVWSVAGDEDRPDVNQTFLQPFVSYNLPGGTSLGAQTETVYDWEQERWTVPLQAFVGQLVKVGKLPVNLQLAGRWWAEGPPLAPEYGIRFIVTFLLPRG